ncbi:MBL fold metallo-hydrolase [Aureimonas fodinaquatilis]|uniref:MBL fold metallo-hydrolase n=1 Tax=Aureimonas fodinaquatilis TaxID=2565783 RepID=A0A5B0DY88_9HYPH|nr:MBL fold metallo-hydrolase [Aureimonas fodinaquatilis]KAA0971787.1 MBL fold metallo-hydrolase [Aureimonas fodinaquatilis]
MLQARIIPVTPFSQNCCLLFDGEQKLGVVVDPGGDVPDILAAIEQQGVKVEAIWLTHGHIDHAGGAMALKDALGVEIIGPERSDEPLMQRIEDQARMFGVGGDYQNATPDRWLVDGDRLSIAGHEFEVIHAPGHSPGHVVFYNRAAGFLHAGDVLFAGSIGRTDLPGGSHETLLATIRNKILPLGDEIGFICGHGPGSRLGDERRTNPFLV